jgi:3-phenylpropionate/cinnamic acid dioxygenase small subunit
MNSHAQNALITLNAQYGDALDRFDLQAWKSLFTRDAVYRAQARENFDRGLPLAAIYLDGQAMMADRITGIEKTLVFAPRYTRHIIGLSTLVSETTARTPFLIVQTVGATPPEMLATGCYHDTFVETAGGLRLSARNAVYDNALIPNSLVYPL